MKRIRGLDSIRALCALWVVISHFGAPPISPWLDMTSGLAQIIVGIYNNFWNGPAAVIVFFVISGFVIHYPFKDELGIASKRSYFIRRYVRICVPMIVAILASLILQNPISFFHDSILWSLVAELIYYSLYPLLLILRRHGVSFDQMIVVSFGVAFCLAATQPSAGNYPSFGVAGNWLLGLPCWLLGCRLAESELSTSNTQWNVNHLRLLVWGVSVTLSILRFHSPIGYPWTLNLFAILVAIWLSFEIKEFAHKSPPKILEWMGSWSYSLYLTHGLAHTVIIRLSISFDNELLLWSIKMLATLTISYIFYLLIEYPSHRAARWLSTVAPRSN